MRSERGFYLSVGAAALLLATLPYLYAWWKTPAGHVYTGLLHNIDDCAVYLSWMRQVAEGHFFQSNRFSTEPQHSVLFNLWFLVLGTLSRVLPPILVFHLGRIAGGAALLWAAARLCRETLAEERARRWAFALCAFAGGLGWLWGGYDPARGFDRQPIDLFQPEAITFQSLVYSPLFAPATACMALFFAAFLRAERTGRRRDLVPAAVCGALLGNFHSYDVLHLFAVAGAYRIASDVAARRPDREGWLRLILLGLATLPTTAYVFWAFRVDPLFHARAKTLTLTAPLPYLLLGLGIPVLLALFALLRPGGADAFTDPKARRFLLCAALAGIAVAYLPFEFQRKMLMGVHLSWCLLAGAGLHALTARLPGDFPKIAAGTLWLLTIPSNGLFVVQALSRLDANASSTQYRPYLTQAEVEALVWLRETTRPSEPVLVAPDPTAHLRYPFLGLLPHLAAYVPALAGNIAYGGHWSETLNYEEKVRGITRFFRARTDQAERDALLGEAGIRYVLYLKRLADGPLTDAQGQPLIDPKTGAPQYEPVTWPRDLPPNLTLAYENAEIAIYRVAS